MFLPNLSLKPHYFSKKQLFRTRAIRRKANPIYLKSCEFFGATLIDRTQTLDSGFDFQILDLIPLLDDSNFSFQQVCVERAEEIINATKGEIKMLWSGGIDSTVALIALLLQLEKSKQVHRLKVLFSKESIAEYPSFFKDVIDNKLSCQLIETTIYDDIDGHEIIVTGENGDQLFGSDKLKYPILSGDAFAPYEEILDFIISRKLGTDKFTHDIIDYLAPQIIKSPVKIVTLYDYFWWLNFSLKWQSVSMRLIHGLDRHHSDLEKTVFHFFKSNYFQKWSIANHDQKIKKDWNTYKFIAKEYIYNFHQDRDYLINKEKEQSLKEVIVDNTKTSFFLRHARKFFER